MRHMLFLAFIAAACSDAHEHADPALEAVGGPVTCSPRLDRYPVAGPHNGGYDRNALTYTCPPHPNSSRDGSDFLAGDHYGNDIFAARGTPLVAPRAGVVVRAGYSGISGLRVTIRDDCGWHYFLAHLDTLAAGIAPNVRVNAGDPVGTVGNTGNAINTSPHLHFSIYPEEYTDGIDPFPYLEAVDHTACGGCDPRCDGSVIIDAGCGRGDCGAFGLTCSMASGSPACAQSGCTPGCDGDEIVSADCGRGDCGAFGATCVMKNGTPTCELACAPRCEGTQIVSADCGRGDCAAFGATCVMRNGTPTCEQACAPRCEGTVMVSTDCGRGDCGAFGATCVMKDGQPTCELSCAPHCEGSVIVSSDCGRGDCGAFGLTCAMVGGTPECVTEGCVPRCDGSVIVGADCGRGDCAAFGASCVMRNGAPACELGCTPHCEGNVTVAADCSRGDCGAFGATCVLDSGGAPRCEVGCVPRCDGNFIVGEDCGRGNCGAFGLTCVVNQLGDPECGGWPPCVHRCDGDEIVMSNCSRGDCGAFGLTCADFGVGPHCTQPACAPQCDGDVIVNSACERADCGVFGLTCTTAGNTAPHCAVPQCLGLNGLPRESHVCIGADRYKCLSDGTATDAPCPIGQSCNACGGCGPLVESCNYRDDDCDGAIDEGVKNACGRCGSVPVESCNFLDDDCDGQTDEGLRNACGGCGAVAGETCNFLDDDCDGQTDEGVANACGRCGAVASETCNYLDDDCDGETDEGLRNACGRCEESIEICNDVDDDCDGQTDEGFEGRGQACSAGLGACLRSGLTRCAQDGQAVACAAVPGEPSEERCNGLDDDCDGENDEGFPFGEVCVVGAGACAVAGQTVCGSDGEVVCEAVEAVCDDRDPCTTDRCDAGTCSHAPIPECCAGREGVCKDGEVCEGGQCQGLLCLPCDMRTGCPGDAVCISYPGGSACATRCAGGGCPSGFQCTVFSSDGQLEEVEICVAESETCECKPPEGPVCDGNRWVGMASCNAPLEVLETCEYGCVAGLGCCPAGTRATDGLCQSTGPEDEPCELPEGPVCDGDRWVRVVTCDSSVEVLETCENGCVAGLGCCPAGTRVGDGQCVSSRPESEPSRTVEVERRDGGCSAGGSGISLLCFGLWVVSRRRPRLAVQTFRRTNV